MMRLNVDYIEFSFAFSDEDGDKKPILREQFC